jgi:hypothetical protein
MNYLLLSLAALPALLSGQFLPQKAGEPQTLTTCTLLGCFSAAAISIQLADGGVPKFDLTLNTGGKPVTCSLPDQSGYLPFGQGKPCGRTATVTVREVSPGKVEALLVIRGTPKSIAISLATSGHAVAQRTFTPEYVEHSPNGPNCEPHCRFWRFDWLI